MRNGCSPEPPWRCRSARIQERPESPRDPTILGVNVPPNEGLASGPLRRDEDPQPSGPRLIEPERGVFVLECEYGERFLAKNAGLAWHAGERCRRARCAACTQGLGAVWWTKDLAKAVALVEYADSAARVSLMKRAGPALAKAEAAKKKEQRAQKVKKLQRSMTLRASAAEDSDINIPVPDGLDYLPYQRAGIAFALGRTGTLIADEMGLGKTIEALGVLNADLDVQRVLIVCPATLKLNWARECERWLTREFEIGVAGKSYPADADVVIVNYDILGKWQTELRAQTWDVLIADECHYVKNRDAKRTKRLFKLKAKRQLFLTGTPILNRPAELFSIASHLCPDEFGHFWTYAKKYCAPIQTNFGWDTSGASNLDELHENLRGTIMVRRTKDQVLKELPPKRRQVIELNSDSASKLIEAEREAWARHREQLGRLKQASRLPVEGDAHPKAAAPELSDGERAELRKGVAEAFGELSKLRHSTALAKVPMVIEHIKAALEESPKIVLFAHHRDVVAALAAPFEECVVTLTGEHSPEQRQAAVDRFQADPECTLFIGSITAAGFGLTLTAASHVVFAELDWVPANMTQAEDRTHRIGQKNSVLVQHLVLQGSLDASMSRTLLRKQQVVNKVVDGTPETDLFEAQYVEALLEAARQAE